MICTAHKILFGLLIERNEMGGACRTYVGKERLYRVLVGKPEGKRQLERRWIRWDDFIKIDLEDVGCVGVY